jgi:hypothetical protein
MSSLCALQAIVVSSDQRVIGSIPDCLSSVGINAAVHQETESAIRKMRWQKVDAFFVDRDLDPDLSVLDSMRTAPSNRRALGFAIIPREHSPGGAFRLADFLLDKPLLHARLNQTIRAAYGIMLKERMRYFRHALRTDVTLIRSAPQTACATTLNVSQTGMALQSAVPIVPEDIVEVRFSLPDSAEQLKCQGRTIWKDARGKAGFEFTKMLPGDRERLTRWTENEFSARMTQA